MTVSNQACAGRCPAMDPDCWADFVEFATGDVLASQLKRYEWLSEFVMAAPDCARADEYQELWRRIAELHSRGGGSETPEDESPTPLTAPGEPVPVYVATDEDIPF